jgi:NAD(P)-dependent dehydrogenase (short-subunit alcohol dehydrogenase family)
VQILRDMSIPDQRGVEAADSTHWAVVTGAASGMGMSTAAHLRQHGWQVLGLDLAPPAPDAEATDQFAQVDITDREAVDAALHETLPEDAEVRLVANIAGIYPPSTLETFTEALYRRVFDVNVLGTLNVIAAARPLLGDGAVVVNFASVDAFTVSPGQLLYGASKAAVVMLTKELALELAPAGVRVNAIAPGWVATPGNAATGRMDAAASSIPLGRVAQPLEVAQWVRLLADNCGFMTGETIVLSGGAVLR